MGKYKAVLLIGATGTGKTPFGQQLETQDLWGKRYHHFDFGEQLRLSVSGNRKYYPGKKLIKLNHS